MNIYKALTKTNFRMLLAGYLLLITSAVVAHWLEEPNLVITSLSAMFVVTTAVAKEALTHAKQLQRRKALVSRVKRML